MTASTPPASTTPPSPVPDPGHDPVPDSGHDPLPDAGPATSVAGRALFDGDFWVDPYPALGALREHAPAREVALPDGPAWLITRYADVRAALIDPRLVKDWRNTLPAAQRADAPGLPHPMMLLLDPPDHTRLRKLVTRSFTAPRTQAMRPRVEQIAAELLDDLPVAADGTVDLVEHYAALLPVRVICELLGVPLADRADFGRWSTTMIDREGDTQAAAEAMTAYLGRLVETRRATPDDALLSALIDVADADGDRLSQPELIGMSMLLLVAGHETTTNLIATALVSLLQRPADLTALVEHPERLPAAVEEFLRHDTPVYNATLRFAAEDVEVAGTVIPQGALVYLSLGSANRDPDRFPDADELRLDRDTGGHVAFGHGLHFCLGAQLARIEGEVALRALLTRHPDLRAARPAAELPWRRSTLVRGVAHLPVVLGPPA